MPTPDVITRLRSALARLLCGAALLGALPAAAGPPTGALADVYGSRYDHAALMAAYQAALAEHGTPPEDAAGYRWRAAPPQAPDWGGAGRDTAYFLGYQFAVIALLYVSPESVSGWDSEDKEDYSFTKWQDNVSRPVWDEDRWWINYILHPYWGGAYYIRGRERGLSRAQSFWYSALLSTLYEYGAEALYEPVSVQDVFVTPLAGYLVGEYLFAPWRERIRAKPGPLTFSDKVVLAATDPLGVLNAETDRLLGVNTTLRWQPLAMPPPAPGAALDGPAAHQPEHLRHSAPLWGLQLRIDW